MATTLDEQTQFVDGGGKPIVNGFIYIGDVNADPVTNPKSIFSDRALTTPLANPQRTNANGRSVNKIWLDGKYSIKVSDSNDVQRYLELDNGTTTSGLAIISLDNVIGENQITAQGGITAYTDNQQFVFKTALANTGPVTLNVDNVGALSILTDKNVPIGRDQFKIDQMVIVVYNATKGWFEWVNQLPFPTIVWLTNVTGTANAITAQGGITSFTDNQQFVFKTNVANTGDVTLNVDSLGAVPVLKNHNQQIGPNQFKVDQMIIVVYNAIKGWFEWVNQLPFPTIVSLTNVSGGNTITAQGGITAYTDNQQFVFKTALGNTGPVTLNVDNIGARFINTDKNVPIGPNQFKVDQMIIVVYNATQGWFEWVNQLPFPTIVWLTNVTGTANAITAQGGITTYTGNQQFVFKTNVANTGDVTLNVDNVGTTSILKNKNVQIAPGQFKVDQMVIVIFNFTKGWFEWVNQLP